MNALFADFYRKPNSELEARFGSFSHKGKFIPNLHQSSFNAIKKLCAGSADSTVTFIAIHASGVKVIQTLDTFSFPWKGGKKKGKTVYQKKNRCMDIDFKDRGFRLSLSVEEPVMKVQLCSDDIKYMKLRQRLSFVLHRVKFDLSFFREGLEYKDIELNPLRYEIELEATKQSSKADFTHAIELVLQLMSTSYFGTLRCALNVSKTEMEHVIQTYFVLTGKRRFVGVQPETFRKDKLVKTETYAVTRKLDGLRVQMIVDSSGHMYLLTNSMKVIKFGGSDHIKCMNAQMSLFDAELMSSEVHFFDAICFNGRDLRSDRHCGLRKRLEILNVIIPQLKLPVKCVVKEYFFDDVNTKIKIFMNDTTTQAIDGIILIPVNAAYPITRNEFVPLKWKPAHFNSIDLLLKKKRVEDEFEIWELFYSIGNDSVEPFSPEGYPYLRVCKITKKFASTFFDNTIAEFKYLPEMKMMVPIRSRLDKERPNFKSVVMDNWRTILNPEFPSDI
jgi:hypothetical protein